MLIKPNADMLQKATQAEAEAGTDNTKLMTPYTTAYSANQAISKKIISGYTKTIPISALRAELASLSTKRMEGSLNLIVQSGDTDDDIVLSGFDCTGYINITGESKEACRIRSFKVFGVRCSNGLMANFSLTSSTGNAVACIASNFGFNNVSATEGVKSTENNVGFYANNAVMALGNGCIVSNKAIAISGYQSTINVRQTIGTNNELSYDANGGAIHVGYDASVEGQSSNGNGGIVATPTSIVKSPVGGFWQILRFDRGIQPVLPAGGTWAWMNFQKNSLTSGPIDYVAAGVSAGGAALTYNPNYANFLFCWRVV